MSVMLKGRSAPGIGFVVFLLSIIMVVTVGAVMAIDTPPQRTTDYENGQLRSYPIEPEERWSLDLSDMRTYDAGATPLVAGTFEDTWLISYPSGLGNTYLAIDRRGGERLWPQPIDAGLGSCALNARGEVGCAVRLGDHPDGFYTAELDTGELDSVSDLDSTQAVTGYGPDYLRVNSSGYQVSRNTPDGTEVWARTFAGAATVEVDGDVAIVRASDGTQHLIDPATGDDRFGCSCDLVIYPTGIAAQFTERDAQRIEFLLPDGTSTSNNDKQQLVPGPSTLAVTTGAGSEQIYQTQGTYAAYDPQQATRLWQVSEAELSKVGARPCGDTVAFARKDGTRAVLDLATADKLGELPRSDPMSPSTNIDILGCVGQGGNTIVFGGNSQLTAYNIATGTVAWQRSVVGGQPAVVDGYLVLEEGTTLSLLAPS